MAQTHEAAFFFEPNELSKKFEALTRKLAKNLKPVSFLMDNFRG